MTVSAGKLLLRGVRLTECHLGVVEIVVFRTAHGFAAYARRLVLERAPAWLTAYRRIAVLGGGRRRGRRGRRGRAPQPCAGVWVPHVTIAPRCPLAALPVLAVAVRCNR
jgi:hypothetical protein